MIPSAPTSPAAPPSSAPAAGPRAHAVRGTMALGLGYGLSAVANLLASVLIGRTLGAGPLGVFAFAVSASRVFFAGSELGLAAQLTRAVARDAAAGGARIFHLFFTLRALLVPAGVAVTLGAAWLVGVRGAAAIGVTATAIGLLTLQALYEALLLGRGAVRLVAWLTSFASLATIAACLGWLLAGGGLTSYAGAYAASVAVGLLAWAGAAATRAGCRPGLRWDARALAAELRESIPIGGSLLLVIATLKAPVLILSALRPETDVGCYAAAEVFVTGCGIAQVAVSGVTFPRLAASHGRDRAAFWSLVRRSNLALAAIGVAAALVLGLAGRPIVELFFPGRDFARLAGAMPVMGASVPFLLLVNHNVYVFAAADRQAWNTAVMAGSFVAMVALQLALVPSMGVLGAAWGLLAGRAIAALFLLGGARRLRRGG